MMYLQSGYFGWVQYGGTLVLGADADGLYIATPKLFGLLSFAHPPLYIPWRDITSGYGSRWGRRAVSLGFLRQPDVTVLLPPHTAEKLAARSAGSFVCP